MRRGARGLFVSSEQLATVPRTGDWDDDRFSRVAYGALAAWYEKFPEFGGNDLYLTGESYAGIYIPRLAKAILEGGDEVRPEEADTAAFYSISNCQVPGARAVAL